MSWRNQMADVQSGKVSYYKKQDNGIGQGFANFANIIAKDMMQDDRDEKEAEKLRLKEEKAERKRIATATAAQEAKDKKMKTAAQMLATTFSGDKTNTGAVEYFYGQLSIFDGNVDAVMDMAKSMVDSGSLSFPSMSETLPFQGPDQPQNRPIPEALESRVSGNKSITNFTSGKPIAVDDLEYIARKDEEDKFKTPFGADAEQMREDTAPLSSSYEYNEETGEIKPSDVKLKPSETVTTSGVEVTAYGQKSSKLDVNKMKDLNTIRLYEMELQSGGIPLSSQDQALLTSEKERLKKLVTVQTDKEAKDFRRTLVDMDGPKLQRIIRSDDFTEQEKAAALVQKNSIKGEPFNIVDYDDVKTSTIQSIIDRADTHPTLISERIVQLQTLLSNRNKETAPIGDGKTFIIQVKGEDGLPETVTAKLNTNNKWVDLNNPTQTVTPLPNTPIKSLEAQGELFDRVIKINQSHITPLKKQRIAMSSTLSSAKRLDDMVNPAIGGDPTILTTVGGTLPRFIQGIALEANAVVEMFNTQGPQQALAMIESRIQANIPDGVDKAARLAYLFQAEKIKLAFSFAASSMGQSGQGLSNKDFENAMKTIDSGKDYETFTKNLRSQAASVVAKTTEMINNFNDDDSVGILRGMQDGLFEGYGQTAEEYSKRMNIGDNYTWSQTKYTKPGNPQIITTDAEYKALGPGVSYIKNGKRSTTPSSKIAGEM